ncbi:MAG: hypothetical protein ACTS3F_12660 [Phycisphaerales bacterium]
MTKHTRTRLITSAMCLAASAATASAGPPCEPAWSDAFAGAAGMNLTVNTLAVYDDGTGPALYAGGFFTTAGGVTVNRVARWDGTSWSALTGPSGTGLNGAPFAMAVYDDGSGPALYVGGAFSQAGGVTVNNIAKWDGATWSALSGPAGTGTNSNVNALTVHDDGSGPALYAGGFFATAGGVTVNRIARWNAAGWSALPGPSATGVDNVVFSLASFDDGNGAHLYAGGTFTNAGGVLVNRIARWNGSAWAPLVGVSDVGVSGRVSALGAVDDGTGQGLFAGGLFTSAGGQSVNRIAKWDGSAWSPLEGPTFPGLLGEVLAITEFDDGSGPALFVGGEFTSADGVILTRIAKWNGSSWSALLGPDGINGVNNLVEALVPHDDGTGPALFAGGPFTSAGGVAAARVAKWQGCAVAIEECAPDFDGSGTIDSDDLGTLLGAFGTSDAGDVDGDGDTDSDDLGILLSAFGGGCE